LWNHDRQEVERDRRSHGHPRKQQTRREVWAAESLTRRRLWLPWNNLRDITGREGICPEVVLVAELLATIWAAVEIPDEVPLIFQSRPDGAGVGKRLRFVFGDIHPADIDRQTHNGEESNGGDAHGEEDKSLLPFGCVSGLSGTWHWHS